MTKKLLCWQNTYSISSWNGIGEGDNFAYNSHLVELTIVLAYDISSQNGTWEGDNFAYDSRLVELTIVSAIEKGTSLLQGVWWAFHNYNNLHQLNFRKLSHPIWRYLKYVFTTHTNYSTIQPCYNYSHISYELYVSWHRLTIDWTF